MNTTAAELTHPTEQSETKRNETKRKSAEKAIVRQSTSGFALCVCAAEMHMN